MAEKNKRGFHTVEEPDMEEYERKLREHRVKVVRRTVIQIVTVLAVSAGLWVFKAPVSYTHLAPSVISELKNGSAWYVPGGKSTSARIYADAGANYPLVRT